MPDVKLGWHRGVRCAVWYDEAGHRQRRSLGTADPELAQTRLASIRVQLNSAAPAGALTVGAIFQAYILDREKELPSIARIKSAWKRLGPHFGHVLPKDLTKDDGHNYIALRRKAGAGDGTIWTELVYLRAALEFGVTSGWLTKAPYVPVPPKPAPREHHLTRAEAKRLWKAAVMPHVALFIRLALATAGRASALLELTWDRVDLERRRIALHDPFRHRTKKGRATVPINDGLFEALTIARKGALSPYVIEWGGERVSSVKKGVAASARRAKVKCSPHVLRHTAAVWMAEGGVPMSEISQFLGHTSTAVTERVYARYSPGYLAEAAKMLDL